MSQFWSHLELKSKHLRFNFQMMRRLWFGKLEFCRAFHVPGTVNQINSVHIFASQILQCTTRKQSLEQQTLRMPFLRGLLQSMGSWKEAKNSLHFLDSVHFKLLKWKDKIKNIKKFLKQQKKSPVCPIQIQQRYSCLNEVIYVTVIIVYNNVVYVHVLYMYMFACICIVNNSIIFDTLASTDASTH